MSPREAQSTAENTSATPVTSPSRPAANAQAVLVGRKKLKAWHNGLLVLTAISSCAFALELVVRATVDVPLFPRYITERRLISGPTIRQNIPGARYRHSSPDGTWDFSINANGFRDERDFPHTKPPGSLRVLVLGDSFTVGYEVRQDETYATRLENELRGALEAPVEVLNAGMSGMGTAEQYAFLKHEGFRYNPDAVVLGFFRNDYNDSVRSNLYSADLSGLLPRATIYAPATRVSNVLYRIPGYSALAQHSALHALANERLGILVKRLFYSTGNTDPARGPTGASVELVRAILGQMSVECESRGVVFVVLDIAPSALEDSLIPAAIPELALNLVRSRDFYESCCPSGIFRENGHNHWTPAAHAAAAESIARTLISSLTGES